MNLARLLATPCLTALLLVGVCAHAGAPIPPVPHVDLSRYLGRWYVIASIPTRFERGGHNPVETYQLDQQGRVCTAFRFRPGSFGAPPKMIHSIASVMPGSGNAEWQVHLFWLLRLQYLVAWLAPDYSRVIVARDARDYVWLMARTPQISASEYQRMVARVGAMGYDLAKLREVPQRWTGADEQRPPGGSVCH